MPISLQTTIDTMSSEELVIAILGAADAELRDEAHHALAGRGHLRVACGLGLLSPDEAEHLRGFVAARMTRAHCNKLDLRALEDILWNC